MIRMKIYKSDILKTYYFTTTLDREQEEERKRVAKVLN